MSDDEIFVLEESTATEFTLIPDETVLEAKVAEVKIETTKMKDQVTGEPVKQVVFKFAILDEPFNQTDEGQQRFIWGRTSTKFSTHENCRLHAWVLEIMAVDELPAGFKLNLQDLVGNQCRVVAEVNTWDDKKKDPDENGEYPKKSNNRVKELLRSRAVAQPSFSEEPF